MADRGTQTLIALPSNHISVNPSVYTPKPPYYGVPYGSQTAIISNLTQGEEVTPKTTGQLWPRGDLS